ncbi:hypothetical protein RB593_005770 [Gaeumannomyces tritici]
MAVLEQYSWIIGLITIALCASSFGNGANDVANAYANSVAARTMTMPQVGILTMFTEFFGAVALGSRVTGTIKNNVIDLGRFQASPSVLILAMGCVEMASASFLLVATKLGFPVSTTQTVIGALVGAGIAANSQISWGWKKGSVSQIAASWVVAPCTAAAISAALFGTLKFAVLERKNSFEKAMRAIRFYLAFTASMLALFITVEAPGAPSPEDLGAVTAVGIVLGVFVGVLALSYIFFVPYAHRRLVMEDPRIRARHMILGPLLRKENPPIFWPAKGDEIVVDHYATAEPTADNTASAKVQPSGADLEKANPAGTDNSSSNGADDLERGQQQQADTARVQRYKRKPEPEERFLGPTAHLPMYKPQRLWSYATYWFLQGVTRDCVTHAASELEAVHGRAHRYDNRVEHLWTYAQIPSAMMMSIAHGSNDVANAVGPWVAAYQTYQTGLVSEDTDTPIWILIVAGFLLGFGFWCMGHHIVSAMGNRLTQLSPTRGFSMELGAAITVLMASRLALPISTTQTLMGAVCGVGLMNMDAGAVNWRQIGKIALGWILTLPCAGLLSGLMFAMALNTPHFT